MGTKTTITKDLALGLADALDVYAEDADALEADPQGASEAASLALLLRAHRGGAFDCPARLVEALRHEIDNEIDKADDDPAPAAARYCAAGRRALRGLSPEVFVLGQPVRISPDAKTTSGADHFAAGEEGVITGAPGEGASDYSRRHYDRGEVSVGFAWVPARYVSPIDG